MIIALQQPASAASCAVVTNPNTPYSQSGNTCVNFTANPTINDGGVTNTGTVNATGATVRVSRTGITVLSGVSINGGITNQGTITTNPGAGAGIVIFGTINGSIVNATHATINAGTGININTFGTIGGSIVNNGLIISHNEGGVGVGHAMVFGGVTNTGTISGAGAPIDVSQATLTGSVINTGKLVAVSGSVAISIANGGSIGGSVTNSGNISVSHPGGLAIQVLPNGSETQTIGGSVINDTGGTMTAAIGIGLVAYGTPAAVIVRGDVANNGTINAGVTGISVLSATIGGNVTNSGTITAGEYGIQLTNSLSGKKISGPTSAAATTTGHAGPASIGGSVVNSGSITSTGSGFAGIVLNGAVVSQGVTNAAAGTISASNGVGILLSNQSQITFTNGTAYLNTGGPATVSGGITNNGTITAKTGIMVTGGSVVLGGITNSGDLSGSVAAINLTGEGAPTTITVLGGAITGNIIGGGADTLNFDLGSGTFTYTGAISAVATVNVDGTLYDNNSISAANVYVLSGGGLAPGLPGTIGTLNITGNLTFESGSGYDVRIAPGAGNNSTTAVTGGATLLGGTVVVTPILGKYNTIYQIITTTNGVTGTFGSATPTINGDFSGTMKLDYATNAPYDVDLDVVGSSLLQAPAGANQNQQNVVNGINNGILASPANTSLPPQFQNLGNLSGAALLNALTQLDGEDATGAEQGAFTLMNEFLELMQGQGFGGGGGGGGGGLGFAPDEQTDSLPPELALAYASILKAPPQQTFDQRWSAWASGFGGGSFTDGNAAVGSNNVTTATYGTAAGMQYRVDPDTVLGFALAGAGLNWGLAQGLGTGRSDAFQAGVYGKSTFGPAYLSGALAFGNNWFTTNRTALGDQLTANFSGQSYAARGEAGYRYALPTPSAVVGVTPYAAVQTQWFHTPAYSETDLSGGALGLTYASANANDTRSELGARFDDLTALNGTPLLLRARLAWAHDWTNGAALNAAFESLPGSSFTVNGAPVPLNSALTTASAQYFFTPALSFTAKFDGEFASTSQTYAGSGTLKYTW